MKIIDADALPRHGRRGGLVYWKDIENAPTVDAVPVKHGHWIYDKYNKHTPKCSVCGNFLDMRGVNVGRGDANYCPNCGARMDEEVKNG